MLNFQHFFSHNIQSEFLYVCPMFQCIRFVKISVFIIILYQFGVSSFGITHYRGLEMLKGPVIVSLILFLNDDETSVDFSVHITQIFAFFCLNTIE